MDNNKKTDDEDTLIDKLKHDIKEALRQHQDQEKPNALLRAWDKFLVSMGVRSG